MRPALIFPRVRARFAVGLAVGILLATLLASSVAAQNGVDSSLPAPQQVKLVPDVVSSSTKNIAAACSNGVAYIFGGYIGDQAFDTIQILDLNTLTATISSAKLPYSRTQQTAVCTSSGVYLFDWNVVRYNPTTNHAEVLRSGIPNNAYNPAVAWDGTHAYVMGGHGSPDRVDIISRYTPSTGAVATMGARLPVGLESTATAFDGRYIYIIGGNTGDGSQGENLVDTILRYDPVSDTLRTMGAKLPTKMGYATATWDGDRIYIFGGYAPGRILDTILQYNPSTDELRTLDTRLPIAVDVAAAVVNGKTHYIIGGRPAVGNESSRAVMIFNSENIAPTAAFKATATRLSLSVDAKQSNDPNGKIMSYVWDWGDSTARSTGDVATHLYTRPGTYTVTLTVTDDMGTASTTTRSVDVKANQPPTSAFRVAKSKLEISVDASASADSDGSISSYQWDWGDASTFGVGRAATHSYVSSGTYTVRLTVTDNEGLSHTSSQSVTVAPNQRPTASFTVQLDGLQVRVDGSQSSDRDDRIVSYEWDWGDGSPRGESRSTAHEYAQPGTYFVKLVVRDQDGADAQATKTVTVSTPTQVQGKLKDRNGNALAGAAVFLLNEKGGNLERISSALSGSDGAYSLPTDGQVPSHVAAIDEGHIVASSVAAIANPNVDVSLPLRTAASQPLAPGELARLEAALESARQFDVGSLRAGETGQLTLDGYAGIREIEFKTDAAAKNAQVVIAKLREKGTDRIPDPPRATPTQWFAVSFYEENGAEIPLTWIRFHLVDDGLSEQGEVVLAHFKLEARSWELLPANATTPGTRTAEASSLSLFAVGVVKPNPFVAFGAAVSANPVVSATIAIPLVGALAFFALHKPMSRIITSTRARRRSSREAKLARREARDPQSRLEVTSAQVPPPALQGDEIIVAGLSVDKGETRIINDVSFAAKRGETVVLLGPSGSGKSTALKAMMGELEYTGEIEIFGQSPIRDRGVLKNAVGYVSQETQLYPEMTVRQNVEYFGGQYGLPATQLKVKTANLLRTLGLDERAEAKVRVLSGGQQRRASIAATLIHSPELLVLDEPTSGLDPITRRNLWKFLKQANRELGITFLVTTHFLDEAEFADQVLILNKGKLVASGTSDALVRSLPGGGRLVIIELNALNQPIEKAMLEALAPLSESGLIKKIEFAAESARIFTPDPQQLSLRALEVLSATLVPIKKIGAAEATLDDVFSHYAGEAWMGDE